MEGTCRHGIGVLFERDRERAQVGVIYYLISHIVNHRINQMNKYNINHQW